MIILITNDDGITSEGLSCLAKEFEPLGDVWIVAPAQPQNAVGRALTLHRPLKVVRLAQRMIAVNGTPSDCVNLAVNKLLPAKPALVVSGINMGSNMGDDISYSGTVAAAFEATILKIPAMAVSMPWGDNTAFTPAARLTSLLARKVLKNGLPPDVFLNVNIPETPRDESVGFKITHQGKSLYDNSIIERTNPRGETYYWIGGDGTKHAPLPDSDAAAVSGMCVSITPIKTDLTDYKTIDVLRAWKL